MEITPYRSTVTSVLRQYRGAAEVATTRHCRPSTERNRLFARPQSMQGTSFMRNVLAALSRTRQVHAEWRYTQPSERAATASSRCALIIMQDARGARHAPNWRSASRGRGAHRAWKSHLRRDPAIDNSRPSDAADCTRGNLTPIRRPRSCAAAHRPSSIPNALTVYSQVPISLLRTSVDT